MKSKLSMSERELFLSRIPPTGDHHFLAKWCSREWKKVSESFSTTSLWTYGLAIQMGFKGHMREWSDYIECSSWGVPSKVSDKLLVTRRSPKLQIRR